MRSPQRGMQTRAFVLLARPILPSHVSRPVLELWRLWRAGLYECCELPCPCLLSRCRKLLGPPRIGMPLGGRSIAWQSVCSCDLRARHSTREHPKGPLTQPERRLEFGDFDQLWRLTSGSQVGSARIDWLLQFLTIDQMVGESSSGTDQGRVQIKTAFSIN